MTADHRDEPSRGIIVAADGDANVVGDGATGDSDLVTGDRERIIELFGHVPRGDYEIVVRGDDGDPVVVRNAPILYDGSPMPTRYWLVGPAETRAVSRLESSGGVRQAAAAIDPALVADAHHRYAVERDGAIPATHTGPRPYGGVAGTRQGLKCLHAHYAWFLAGGDDPVGAWVAHHLESTVTPPVSAPTNEPAHG